ncbi:hypothetical protein ABGT15_12125 [Flavobacterium enshiense]|uniref:hypothetical protein n=1 Tax=Flavobacterium enshiense TaxID=1341165 RepID=UPI00345C7355
MERKLFHEDIQLFNEISSDLKEMKPMLQNLKSAYEALNIGAFTNRELKDLTASVSIILAKNKFLKELNGQLDDMNVKSNIIREKMILDHMHLIEELEQAIAALKSFVPKDIKQRISERQVHLKAKNVSFENGTFTISDDDKENILETYCRFYLTSLEEQEFFDKVQNYVKAYADLKNHMIDNFYADNTNLRDLNVFIEIESDQHSSSFKPSEIKVNKSVIIGMIRRAMHRLDLKK